MREVRAQVDAEEGGGADEVREVQVSEVVGGEAEAGEEGGGMSMGEPVRGCGCPLTGPCYHLYAVPSVTAPPKRVVRLGQPVKIGVDVPTVEVTPTLLDREVYGPAATASLEPCCDRCGSHADYAGQEKCKRCMMGGRFGRYGL
jgi:hypothetical protein